MERSIRLPDEMEINGRLYVAKDTLSPEVVQVPVEEVFTADQVSQMSGVSKRKIYSLMDKNVLAYIVPNGCERPRLVRRSVYERWVGLTT